jgi:molecular chaperone DnaJ
MKDYYATLGVSKDASQDEIKKAFRKLAHEYHPDKKGGNESKFKEVNEAYTTLSDPEKRSRYDQFGSSDGGFGAGNTGFNGGGGFGGFEGFDFSQFTGGGQNFDMGDIFGEFFGGGRSKSRRGKDISVNLEISFKESVFGTKKTFSLNKNSTCDHCKGSGAETGSEMSTCKTCNGKGKIRDVKRTILGSIATERMCETCHGKGKVPKTNCKVCHGHGILKQNKEYDIEVPTGINDGEVLRLSGAGEAVEGGTTGDLYIRVSVKPDPVFHKEGNNLIMDLRLKLSEALIGGEKSISTLDGAVNIKIPEAVSFGEILRIKGKGVPSRGTQRGDILARVVIDMPNKLSKNARKIIEDLKKEGI